MSQTSFGTRILPFCHPGWFFFQSPLLFRRILWTSANPLVSIARLYLFNTILNTAFIIGVWKMQMFSECIYKNLEFILVVTYFWSLEGAYCNNLCLSHLLCFFVFQMPTPKKLVPCNLHARTTLIPKKWATLSVNVGVGVRTRFVVLSKPHSYQPNTARRDQSTIFFL